MKFGSRRALVGLVSVGAVLIPAIAIVYVGAVSYRDDRGIVAAKVEEQFRAAWDVSRDVEAEVAGILAAARSAAGTQDGNPDAMRSAGGRTAGTAPTIPTRSDRRRERSRRCWRSPRSPAR